VQDVRIALSDRLGGATYPARTVAALQHDREKANAWP